VSPANGVHLDPGEIVLTVQNSVPTFDPSLKLTYSFELWTDGTDVPGTMIWAGPIDGGTSGTTSLPIPSGIALVGESTYKWRSRSYVGLDNSEYSAWSTFVAPTNLGYLRGSELYDPLDNGHTVGTIVGPVTFIPGVGARLESKSSWIEYAMPVTATTGEFSAIFTNLTVKNVSSEDPKDRVLTMREGWAPMNDNRFRFSIDVRGNGAAAWRFLTGSTTSYIETTGTGERPLLGFRRANTYFIRGTWSGNRFQVTYKDLTTGATLYDAGKGYGGTYRPSPQVVYVGSPWVGGERGEPSTYDGMIVRQVWMSTNPRPGFANK